MNGQQKNYRENQQQKKKWFSENIKKIDKSRAKPPKKKKYTNYQQEVRDITTYLANIKKMMKEYQKQLNTQKTLNLNEMDQHLEKAQCATPNK